MLMGQTVNSPPADLTVNSPPADLTISETKCGLKFLFSPVMLGVSVAADDEVKFVPTHLIADAAPAIEMDPHWP